MLSVIRHILPSYENKKKYECHTIFQETLRTWSKLGLLRNCRKRFTVQKQRKDLTEDNRDALSGTLKAINLKESFH